MTIYLFGASIVFSIALNAFLKDKSTSKTDISSWVILFLGALIWPLILPSLLRAKLLVPQGNRKASSILGFASNEAA